MGALALDGITTGGSNNAVGYQALSAMNTGSQNNAFGTFALRNATGSARNNAFGQQALEDVTSGSGNTAMGHDAAREVTSADNCSGFGHAVLQSLTTGDENTAFGASCLNSATTGLRNDAFGASAMGSLTTGMDNIGIARQSFPNLTTGNGNVGIGNIGVINQLFDVSTQSDRLLLGHVNITNAYVKVALTVTSDERDKIDFGVVPHGLDFVNKLKPKSFWFRKNRDSEEKNGPQRYGFVAQDIAALEGENPVIIDTEEEHHLKYKGEHLVPVLVKAVQELSAKVTALEAAYN